MTADKFQVNDNVLHKLLSGRYETTKHLDNLSFMHLFQLMVADQKQSLSIFFKTCNLYTGENPCAESECEHICLLSATSDTGYVCGCVAGADLQNDDKSCCKPF